MGGATLWWLQVISVLLKFNDSSTQAGISVRISVMLSPKSQKIPYSKTL